MIVFARKEGTIIWSDNNSTHKAGRVPIDEPLTVLAEKTDWLAIERPGNLSLEPQPGYPNYWVKRDDTIAEAAVEVPDPEPEPWVPDKVSDTSAAAAVLTLLKWFKQ